MTNSGSKMLGLKFINRSNKRPQLILPSSYANKLPATTLPATTLPYIPPFLATTDSYSSYESDDSGTRSQSPEYQKDQKLRAEKRDVTRVKRTHELSTSVEDDEYGYGIRTKKRKRKQKTKKRKSKKKRKAKKQRKTSYKKRRTRSK